MKQNIYFLENKKAYMTTDISQVLLHGVLNYVLSRPEKSKTAHQ
jgi:hypothetical protein